MKGKVRKLTLAIMVIGILAFSPMLWQAWANPDVIDVGSEVINRPQSMPEGYTMIILDNPANLTGTLDTVQVWAASIGDVTGFRIGTFYLVSGTTYKCRDSVAIGTVTSGSAQTFSSLSINVEAGDYLGAYWAVGTIERNGAGFGGELFYYGESIDPDDQATFTLQTGDTLSIYATGETAAPIGGGQVIMIQEF